MKYNPNNIPDVVTNNVVYRDEAGEYIGINGELKQIVGSSSGLKVILGLFMTFLTEFRVGDDHGFVKQVVSSNKTQVFKHLIKNGFNLRLQDLIYLACQHGCLEMTKIIMDSNKVSLLT